MNQKRLLAMHLGVAAGGLAIALTASLFGVGTAQAAGCDRGGAICNGGRPMPSVHFQGDRILTNTIRVEVCHHYWDLLAAPRWWNPTIRYGNWEQDLQAQTTPCHTYDVLPGTDMRLFASCVDQVIGTGPMMRSGTYYMTTAHPN